eukprot:6263692-Alexandrium_andersonii.AAC.1
MLSPEESVEARRKWPGRFMDTRWAFTEKPDAEAEEGWKAKALWIIKGFADPAPLELETYSPT